MRCQSIRSVFRAALVAGFIASFQGPTLSASWKNSHNPLTSTCYIHDLQWEQVNSIRGEYRTEPIVITDSEGENSVDRETELCVAVANQYEFEMQVNAALDALRSKSSQFAWTGAKLFQSYSPSPTLFITSIACQSLKLLEWVRIPDSLPLTVVASDDNQAFDCDWNCRDWRNDTQYSLSISLPKRSTANIFVYSLDSLTESNVSESNSVEKDLNSETSIGSNQFSAENGLSADSDLDSFASDIASADVASAPVASAQIGLDKQINQIGIDPVCPEIQLSNHEITWNDCFAQPSVCYPLDSDTEAIGIEPNTLQATIPVRPPTLEAELDLLDSSNISKIEEQGIGHCAPTLENHCQAEELHAAAEQSGMNYCSQDFLTTLHTSNLGSILLPVTDPHRVAVDYAMTGDSTQIAEPSSHMSKGIASQIRTVGQFLVDFANQIESQLEQVEIARRHSINR